MWIQMPRTMLPLPPAAALLALAGRLSALRCLTVSYDRKLWSLMHDDAVNYLTHELLRTNVDLFELRLRSEQPWITHFPPVLTVESVLAVSTLRSLTSLDVENVVLMTDAAVESLSSGLRNLRQLTLTYLRLVSDSGFRALATLPHLSTVRGFCGATFVQPVGSYGRERRPATALQPPVWKESLRRLLTDARWRNRTSGVPV